MNKKYEPIQQGLIYCGLRLYRIRAVCDFGQVKAGQLGGYLQDGHNLSHLGNCWVADKAIVCCNAQVHGNAVIRDEALIGGFARIYGNAMVMDKAQVLDFARISGNAAIFGDAQVEGYAHISGTMEIGDHAKVSAKRPRRWVTPESLPLDILLQFPQRREKGADKLRGSLLTIGPV